MKTKERKTKATVKQAVPKIVKAAVSNDQNLTALPEGNFQEVETTLVDFSPLNYRKFFDQDTLLEFAGELLLHGIIAPVTVRPMPSGRYELVAGERRLRAAKLAQITTVPSMIRELTDEQVIEIQLAENLQRENPHPLHESFAVQRLQQSGMSIEEIAARLGKTKMFVYSRTKLAGLIEIMQDIFLAKKIKLSQAIEIAGLSPESQYELYEQYCTDWQDKYFSLSFPYVLNQFKFDLTTAVFDTKDAQLVATAGACSECPFNSATLATLFPEFAKEAICSNHVCFSNKCNAQTQNMITAAIEQYTPKAILYNGTMPAIVAGVIEAMPEAKELPQYNRYEITVLTIPKMPDKADYIEPVEESAEDFFNEPGYESAMEEYRSDLAECEDLITAGKAMWGIQVGTKSCTPVLFSPERRESNLSGQTITAKQVQEAIKAGNATPELLAKELARLQSRETRAKELDREKVQSKLHLQFYEKFRVLDEGQNLTSADQTAARLIVYQSLDYSFQNKINKALFAEINTQETKGKTTLFDVLAELTDAQFSYLIRMAIACKSESKLPRYDAAVALYKVAEEGGLDVQAIEQEQQVKIKAREDRLEERTADLQRRVQKLKAAA